MPFPARSLIAVLLLTSFAVAAPPKGDHTDPTWFHNASGEKQAVKTTDDWAARRREVIQQMERVMGPLPDRSKWPGAQVRVLERKELSGGLVRQKIQFVADSNDRPIKAWVFLPSPPQGLPPGAGLPAVLCLHQTNNVGKDEPAGLGGLPNLHYAIELAQRGFVTLAPDYPSFGESNYQFPPEDGYISGSMKAISENMRAIDVLQAMEQVDPDRIGCIGHSLGGHNTMFTAAFDTRIKALVSSCGFTRFHKYYDGNLMGWTSARYMPLIASQYHNNPDEVPFDFPEIVAAFAPRPFLACSPTRDGNFEVSGVRDTIAAATPIYKLFGAEKGLRAEYPDCEHDFPPATREVAYKFLAESLAKP
ncbi:MAG: alpha/beta fold hydrolase [Planctomycetaceae bacterium]